MHHPPSAAAARRLRIAGLLLLAWVLVLPATAGVLLVSLLESDHRLMLAGLAMMILLFVLIAVQWAVASKASCPLCRTPVLAPMGCARHRKAGTLLGSHRLRVASAILLRNRFRCPYCNEPASMQVRNASHR